MEHSKDEQYLSVKQFASEAGCTTQRVYQLLQKRLHPYLMVQNGMKYIHKDGLQVVMQARLAQGFEKVLQGSEHSTEPSEPSPELELLKETVVTLSEQLDAKDKQIESLTNALSFSQQIQQQLSAALDAAQANNTRLAESLNTAQALHAGTLQTIAVKGADSKQNAPQEDMSNYIPPTSENATTDQSEPRQGLLSKIFGKKKKRH